MTQTWSNIQFVINLIAQFKNNIDVAHLKATKYILYFLLLWKYYGFLFSFRKADKEKF